MGANRWVLQVLNCGENEFILKGPELCEDGDDFLREVLKLVRVGMNHQLMRAALRCQAKAKPNSRDFWAVALQRRKGLARI